MTQSCCQVMTPALIMSLSLFLRHPWANCQYCQFPLLPPQARYHHLHSWTTGYTTTRSRIFLSNWWWSSRHWYSVQRRENTLSQSMKLRIVKHTPDIKFRYPTTYMHGCNRRFKPEWVHGHSWLHYSASEDGVYCKACALFAPSEIKQQKLGSLVNKPFSVWTKQSSIWAVGIPPVFHD